IPSLEHARNRDDEAERYYSRSLLLLRQARGPASIDAAIVQSNMGLLRLGARQYALAAALFREAIREIEIASGPDDPALIRALVNLARCENMSGHANEAEALARRAVELSSKMFGQAHVGDCTRNVGRGQRITPPAAQKTGARPGETGKGLLAKQFR